MERIARKLRRIILLQFGLVTFRLHYRRILKPLIFMISGFSDVFLIPKTNSFLFGDAMILQFMQGTTHTIENRIFGNPKMLTIENVEIVLEDWAPTTHEDSFCNLLKIVYLGSTSSKQHEMFVFENLEYEINIYQTT